MFTKYTNMYAEKTIAAFNLLKGPNESLRVWQRVSIAEMKAFIAILINMGIDTPYLLKLHKALQKYIPTLFLLLK